MRPFTFILATVLATGLLAAPGSAQCFQDDGFYLPGSCCQQILPSQVNLPAFPSFTIPADGACFRDCAVEAVFPQSIFLGNAIPLFCDLYAVPITVTGSVSCAPTFLISKYARTWLELDPSGVPGRQVWRFLVNTDLVYQTLTPSPCPVPACATVGMPVHVVGSLDYARDCQNPAVWSVAINLTHHCGDLAHGPTSSRPTTTHGHPGRMFSFVGPAPFDFTAPQPSPQGPVTVGDSVRATDADLNIGKWDCYSELDVTGGSALAVQAYCPCGTGPSRWEQIALRLDYGCGLPTDFLAPVSWPPIVPTGLSAFPLGRYLHPPGSFASDRAVSVYFGVAIGTDPCAGNFPVHVLHGVGTTGGNDAFIQASPVLTNRLLDLTNEKVYGNLPPYLSIGYGKPFLSTMVWCTAFI